jgi:peroxiredoxin
MVQPGDLAQNFSLKDQNDHTVDLYEQAGKRVLLSFHPLAWTEYCAAQMQSLEENRENLASLNTVPVGISVDSVPCKRAWAERPENRPDTAALRLLAARQGSAAVRHLPGRQRVFRTGEYHRR